MPEAKKKNKKIGILIAAALLLIAIIVVSIIIGIGSSNEVSTNDPNKIKAQSEIITDITGTGIIEAKSQFDITTSAVGEVLVSDFEEGDKVKTGDVLYMLDSEDIKSAIDKTRVSVEKAQLAYDLALDNINKLSLSATISGNITNLYINKGDNVAANGKIADVVNDEVMILKVPFIKESTESIYEGQSATVTIVGSFYTVNGTVKKVTSGYMTSADGNVVKMIEINVPNPGTLKKGDKGTAIIGNIACSDAGVFDYSSYETITAEVGGKVDILNKSVGDHVSKNELIARLTNDSFISTQQQNALSIKEANLMLDGQNDQLKDYIITSPIDGTIIKKKIKQGETLDMTNKASMAVVADLSEIIFKMDVDELDISKVKVGQEVSITSDATPGKEYSGRVDSISLEGKQISGVTLYQVTVVVNNPDGLMTNMNVNARISVD